MSIEKDNDSVASSEVKISGQSKRADQYEDAAQETPITDHKEPVNEGALEHSHSGAKDKAGDSQIKADGDSADTISTSPKERHNGRQQRGRGNQRFNKNKGPKNKGHWQKKKKIIRDEVSPIELGELQNAESIANISQIEDLAEELNADLDKDALNFNRIYDLPIAELRQEVDSLELSISNAPNRDQLINALVSHAVDKNSAIMTTGVLDLLEDGEGGLLVYQRDSYRTTALSAYVPQAIIKHFGLLAGHIVKAQLHPHREGESCPFVIKVDSVMGLDPDKLREVVPFTEGVPYYPTERILMETSSDSNWDNLSMRVVDCLTPVGFGQRGLIVAPPRTGKTVLLQGIANAIQMNYPKAHLIILLIDERPEEVTDFRRQVHGEVISSTFDESAESHVHAAEMVIEKARRMVEVGQDVVILLDSITRLARAYNTMMPSSGKILSGGVEANALQKPKRFFGSARNIEGGGSLTILGTALVETGSKMDEVIFEEFKGTGNMELHLDRGLSDKRIFPALSMDKSGTRKEELLYHPDEMLKIYSLRRAMKGLPSTDAMEMLIQRIKKTTTNAEFLMSVSR